AARSALQTMALDARAVSGLTVDVVEVPNDFFGGGVTVSGLLAGHDIAASLTDRSADVAILPRSAFGFEGHQTLDGWTIQRLRGELPMRLVLAGAADELLRLSVADSAMGPNG